jgi:hypothetical protein
MATTTPNFGWPVPTSTDLVKDGATAIEGLGDAIDASLLDLKGGTSGQVLAKNSGTDMDFVWVAQDDSNAIQNAIVDAKGDLIGATAADTPARLAVGTNGQILTADSTEATGLKWTTPAAGGGMTLIETLTLSGASVTSSSIAGTYKNLQLVIRDFLPAVDGEQLYLRFNSDTGSNYQYGYTTGTDNISSFVTNLTTTRANDAAVANGLSIFNIYDYANAVTMKVGDLRAINTNSTNTSNVNIDTFVWLYKSTSAITTITLFSSSGNITSGSALIYGVS